MKQVWAVLGLALLMGCANSNSSDCPRKDKSCGKDLTSDVFEQKDAAQEVTAPSK